MTATTVRLAREDDAEQMLAIYAPIVRETAISFELEPPTEDEFRQRIKTTLERTPWLVYDIDGVVKGYAYAGQFRARAAYQWSVEVTVYVDASARRLGVARAVYTSLFDCLRLQGYFRAFAGITQPNEASVGLHQRLGFTSVGVYGSVGYKLGAWHNVGWWQLALQEHRPSPDPPRLLPDVMDTSGWRELIPQNVSNS